MGVSGFYKWLADIGYQPESVALQPTDTYLVDLQTFLHKFAYYIPSDVTDLATPLAEAVATHFAGLQATFVNDGELAPEHPKNAVVAPKRRAERLEALKRAKRKREEEGRKGPEEPERSTEQRADTQPLVEQGPEALQASAQPSASEKLLRAARVISHAVGREVLALLRDKGFAVIQCETEEADVALARLSRDYTYVLSDDCDLIVAGVNNLLRCFRRGDQCYRAQDVCRCAGLSQAQLKEVAVLAGCDYFEGLKGIGVTTAHRLLRVHGRFEVFWAQLTPRAKAKHWSDEVTQLPARVAEACRFFGTVP